MKSYHLKQILIKTKLLYIWFTFTIIKFVFENFCWHLKKVFSLYAYYLVKTSVIASMRAFMYGNDSFIPFEDLINMIINKEFDLFC